MQVKAVRKSTQSDQWSAWEIPRELMYRTGDPDESEWNGGEATSPVLCGGSP